MKPEFFKAILLNNKKVSLEDAIFRNESSFIPANLQNFYDFWDKEILKDHPHRENLLKWIKGVEIEEFLNSYTFGEFQGMKLDSYYPQPKEFSNYVPEEFIPFMDQQVQEWVGNGALQEWEKVKKKGDPAIPTVVSPLGVEPTKPRALWDGRYVNEFCRDIPFSMDNAAKVAEVAWEGTYFFKIDHKNGYLHVPIHEKSRKFFGICWKGVYYVFTVLPFGWKTSPVIYHSITEAAAMYLRSLDIPMLDWIDDMLGMTQHCFKGDSDEEQFQSALRAMVVTTYVLFKAGYFLGVPKCNLIPEQIMTYLGIDCDSKHEKFLVPEKRIQKYIPILQELLTKSFVSYSEVEKVVGKLVSLECAVAPGMWYTRNQYAAMAASGIRPDAKKHVKNNCKIAVTPALKEEWFMWTHFLLQNKGSSWKKFSNIYVQADVFSDASGRSFAGIVDIPGGPTRVVAGEFSEPMLQQDIQVKEGEALKATLSMITKEMPDLVMGKTLVCKIDNQALKAVLERKGTSHNLALNNVGKQIYWLQEGGQFHIALQYVESENNVSDKFTRQSPGIETSLTPAFFKKIWDNLGPFQWDLMASQTNVNRDPRGIPLLFFSRYFDDKSNGVDVFLQQLSYLEEMFCFPPIPMISKLLKHLQQQKVSCVLLVPRMWAPWRNLLEKHALATVNIATPFESKAFTITHATGKIIPKKFPYFMDAVYVSFE